MAERQELAVIIQEALQRTSEDTALRMMAAYRKGRTVCLGLTQKDPDIRQVEWNVLAPDEIPPGAEN